MKKGDTACRAIRAATTESQVITAVREYLASLDASEIALLPAQILAVGLSQAEEVVQSGLQLIHHEMLAIREGPEAAVLNEMSLVFTTAAKRLAALTKDTA